MKYCKEEVVRFRHCDVAGIVFYPRFFEMINDLVEDWCAEVWEQSFQVMHQSENVGVPAVAINCNFRKSAKLGDRILKCLEVTALTGRSVTVKIIFYCDSEVILEAEKTLVCVDLTLMKAKHWNDAIQNKIQKFMQQEDK